MHPRAAVTVGRGSEVDELRGGLDQARNGRGGTVFLVGEPGIGKTRLASTTMVDAVDRGMRVLRGRSSTIGPLVPFRPLAEALMPLVRSGELSTADELGPYRAVLGRLIPDWDGTGPPDTGGSLIVLAEAVLRLLSLIGRDRGCLLVFEDLHEADVETLAVVEYLVDNVGQQPVLLCATLRAEQCDALDLARVASQRRMSSLLELWPLDRDGVTELVASCLQVHPDGVPRPVIEQVWTSSAGVPFVVEELLHASISADTLVRDSDGTWRVVGELTATVPAALVRDTAQRADRLGRRTRMFLSMAAVFGHRFPLAVVREAAGLDTRTALEHLEAGLAAHLVSPDEHDVDWYGFRHPLTADALRAGLTVADRAELSGRVADAVETLHPGLPGDWCALVASLRLAAGDAVRAGELFAEAGRRALEYGAAGSAVVLLDRANQLLADREHARAQAEILESLLPALAETGQFERAFQLADTLDTLGEGLDRPRTAALHGRLARVALVAGRWADCTAQLDAARAILGGDTDDEGVAPIDAVAAHLVLYTPGQDRVDRAEALARRAVAAAERVPLPAVQCEALHLLGVVTRDRDLAESHGYFERALRVAEEHQLPIRRVYALVGQGMIGWMRDGDPGLLRLARQEAHRIGAVAVVHEVDACEALQAVLTGGFEQAATLVRQCGASVARLKLHALSTYLQMVRVVLAAHQGGRRDMDRAIAEYGDHGWAAAKEQPLVYGLGRAFCSLLDENREQATRELDRARELQAENPTIFHLAGHNGLALLLGVLDGSSDWSHHARVTAAQGSTMRWNRQFVHLAHAVLLGRDGRAADAAVAFGAAQDAAAPYPMARHLGLRLVAEPARADGWGEPVEWLRRAEEHFHNAEVPAVASACRLLLRHAGVTVAQRRAGADEVPQLLRLNGVTVREYEVLRLLADRMSNKAIANRLHISPRTVEKHVASLVTKTRQPNRESLSVYARTEFE
jgi:DNA-binding CsgD family transcriptional regulator